MPGDLVARVDKRVLVEPAEGRGRNIIPDVRVVERGLPQERELETSNGIAVAEPLVVHLEQDESVRQAFFEIIDIKSGCRVITVIEILSPPIKLPGPGREFYLKKQGELRAGGVSPVEIDLIRTGAHVLSCPFDRIPEGHRTPYAACARRGWKPFEIELPHTPPRAPAGHSHSIAAV